MSGHRHRHAHFVQLFDTAESLASTVATFVADGIAAGETAIVLMRGSEWSLTSVGLEARGIETGAAIGDGQLVLLDAQRTLLRLMSHGKPDPARFERVIGSVVRNALASGRRVRIFGDAVDVLVTEREFNGALLLEALWDHLVEQEGVTVLCGYSSPHFGDERSTEWLRRVCSCHSDIRTDEADDLGAWLIQEAGVEAAAAAHSA